MQTREQKLKQEFIIEYLNKKDFVNAVFFVERLWWTYTKSKKNQHIQLFTHFKLKQTKPTSDIITTK